MTQLLAKTEAVCQWPDQETASVLAHDEVARGIPNQQIRRIPLTGFSD